MTRLLPLLLVACAPKAQPETAAPAGPPPLVDTDLADTLLADFSQAQGWTVTPLVQLDRGDTHVLIVWPMLDPAGRVTDDDVVGLTLREDGTAGATNWRPDPRRLVVELGGDDWVARPRQVGVAQEALGQEAVARAEAFGAALDTGDAAGARRAAEDFSRLFAVPLVLDQTVTGLLAREGRWAFLSRQPLLRSATFTFEVGGETVALSAEPYPGDDGRWWFTSPG